MIKAIIFDCWNTLYFTDLKPHPFVKFAERIGKDFFDYRYVKLFEKHCELEIPIKTLLSELNIGYDENLLNELKQILKKAMNLVSVYPEAPEVLENLKQNYKLGMISNTGYLGFEKLNILFKLDEIFDVVLKSYETKILKPDTKIFEIMIKELKISVDKVLMVGDSLKDDVLAAENFGIKGILIDRKGKHPEYPDRITSLEQITNFL